jgi:hypothetical protein
MRAGLAVAAQARRRRRIRFGVVASEREVWNSTLK